MHSAATRAGGVAYISSPRAPDILTSTVASTPTTTKIQSIHRGPNHPDAISLCHPKATVVPALVEQRAPFWKPSTWGIGDDDGGSVQGSSANWEEGRQSSTCRGGRVVAMRGRSKEAGKVNPVGVSNVVHFSGGVGTHGRSWRVVPSGWIHSDGERTGLSRTVEDTKSRFL